jgi:hypothetical protein
MKLACIVLLGTLFALTAARAGTVVEEEADSTGTAVMDLLPEGPWDTFGPVSASDPVDYGTQVNEKGEKEWVVIFWVDPLHGSWIGGKGEPIGDPPYKVFVGGLPERAIKLNKKWQMAKAVPLLTGPDGQASPDNTAWAISFKWFGEVRFILLIESADGGNASGNIVQAARAYIGGDKCGYVQNFNEVWTVTLPMYDDE